MGRIDGWDARLLAVVEDWRDVPFVWGSTDCLHFCMACERAIFGATALTDLPKYKDGKRGFAKLRKMGFADLSHYVDGKYQRIPVPMAQRGDWVLFCVPGGEAFGVVTGQRAAVMGLHGLEHMPLTSASAAWRIAQ